MSIEPKTLQYYKHTFSIYYDGWDIPDDIENLALGEGIDIDNLMIPDTIECLLLMDGFDKEIKEGFIPDTVNELFILDIKHPLSIGSISKSILWLEFGDGYNHSITKGIIPNSVECLYLRNIKKELSNDSIPNSIEKLYLYDGFNQNLSFLSSPSSSSSSLKNLYVYNIGDNILDIGSIPNTIKLLYFGDGFNQTILPNLIPSNVNSLYLRDIKKPLIKNSIPPTITSLYLNEGFNQPITTEILSSCRNLKNLYMYNIKQPLFLNEDHSINNNSNNSNNDNINNNLSIESIHLMPGFNQILKNGILLKFGFKNLYIYDIKQPLIKDESIIPNNVIDYDINLLHIGGNYKFKLTKGIIPCNNLNKISNLYIGNLNEPLIPNESIPNNVESLHLGGGYQFKITSDLIPPSVKNLYLYDINEPITNQSIPQTLKTIFISSQYEHPISDLISPNYEIKKI
ncbi:hypothetical protein ACTFIV_007299 [Dictyostelium citrinum]